MIGSIKLTTEQGMQKALEALKANLAKLRTGRAHPSLLEQLRVPQYGGKEVPLNHVASITVADARTLLVTPWEKSLIPLIEKTILQSHLGLNPLTAGNVIRVPLALLTEERRRDMSKLVKKEAEDARVSIRNYRQDANHQLKNLVKKKLITEDEERRAKEMIQKMTDRSIVEVEKIAKVKEEELMHI
ncbi:ribosome recycling factor [Rickettsiella grylli]|uniref:Ribosome-recycling factor n=1 Tax=Rickettsiella grylli TaxID=59196 RepID=A8PM58_9COXI|nr:ribosome recycling factor [Rickettsiella grylli]EDP45992.1 ribosome recycling factor [Rickettsiella grylli]